MDSPTFGSFGLHPDDVVRTDFYSFFYLAEKRRGTADDGSPVVRHGTPYQFARFVFFDVVADRGGFTKALVLGIAGSFIDGSETAYFARDYAKSFLLTAAATAEDRATLAPLVDDLLHRPVPTRSRLDRSQVDPGELIRMMTGVVDLGQQAVVHLGGNTAERPVGPLPEVPTRAHAVFVGDRPSNRIDLASTRFTITNTHEPPDPGDDDEEPGRWVIMRFERRFGL